MNFKKLATTACAVFFIGLGLAASTAHARPPCSACDATYNNCIISHTEAYCDALTRNCYANCL